jgi:hypothetical protein
MALQKNFNTTYTLNGPQVTITGNLVILGNSSQVESNVTVISDNFLTLNSNETGNGVSTLGSTSGVVIDRGQQPNVAIQWNETTKTWQVSYNGLTNFANILTSTTPGGALQHVSDDPAPALGGNLNTSGYAITANTNVIFGSNLQINNVLTTPSTTVANATVVYASTPAGGTSGVYVLNSQAANQELITKARAFGFSLLL